MKQFSFITDFLNRIKYWILFIPIITGLVALYLTRDMAKKYQVKAEIYTGIVSGINLNEEENSRANWNVMRNEMENLIHLVTSQNTLKLVSLRLLTQHFMYGDPNKDNQFIKMLNYQELKRIAPKELFSMIDNSSEEKTFDRLFAYLESSNHNFLYTLLNGTHPHYSYSSLAKVAVKIKGVSDMLELIYQSDDPGITYYTVIFLNEEFVKQYDDLRYGQVNKTALFLEEELKAQKEKLSALEDSLQAYLEEEGLANYKVQMASAMAMQEELNLKRNDALIQYNSANIALQLMEKDLSKNIRLVTNNQEFIDKLGEVATLSSQISKIELFQKKEDQRKLAMLKARLSTKEEELKQLTKKINADKYNNVGMPLSNVLDKWSDEALRKRKSQVELNTLEKQQQAHYAKYADLLSHGLLLKQKEREVEFEERIYSELLTNLSAVRFKQKKMGMISSNLKTISPPLYPHKPISSKRKVTVLFLVICSAIFVMGLFLFFELISCKLFDKVRTERLTAQKVKGVYPLMKKRRNKAAAKMAVLANQQLKNTVLNHFSLHKKHVVNIISLSRGEGKSYLADCIDMELSLARFNVKILSWDQGFVANTKEYFLADSVNDLKRNVLDEEDVILVEHPPVDSFNIPSELLRNASLNLVVMSAQKRWTAKEQSKLDNLVEKVGETPLVIYLNKTKRSVFKAYA